MNVPKNVPLLLVCLLLVPFNAPAIEIYATDADNQGFYVIDSDTGVVTFVGNYTLVNPGTEILMGGLEFDSDGTLYGISASSSARLYTIDPQSGATTDVGPVGVGFIFEGALAFDPTDGTLYAANQSSANDAGLVTIDPTTGQGTVIGVMGSGNHDFAGLAFDGGGQLFGIDRVTNALWAIDKNNPSGPDTAQIGPNLGPGIDMGGYGGMSRDTATGTIYGFAGGSNHLFTVDLATGTADVIQQLGSDPQIFSLAIPPVLVGEFFIRGDCNGDGSFSGLPDGLAALNFQFVPGTPDPPCLRACDADGSGAFSGLPDGVTILTFQFVPGSPPPPPPYPDCGLDDMSALTCDVQTCVP